MILFYQQYSIFLQSLTCDKEINRFPMYHTISVISSTATLTIYRTNKCDLDTGNIEKLTAINRYNSRVFARQFSRRQCGNTRPIIRSHRELRNKKLAQISAQMKH